MSTYQIKVKVSGLPILNLEDMDKVCPINSDALYKDVAFLILKEQKAEGMIEEFQRNFLIMSDGKIKEWDQKVCDKNILFFLPINGG